MDNKKPKIPFIRRIDTVKDFIYRLHGGNSVGIKKFIESLKKITSIEELFSKTARFDPGNNSSLTPIKFSDLQEGRFAEPTNRFYAYLFPSDLLRALTNLAIIFNKDDKTLTKYGSTELGLIKKWGNYNKLIDRNDYKHQLLEQINETDFADYINKIQKLLNDVLNAYESNKDIFGKQKNFTKPNEDDTNKTKPINDQTTENDNDGGGGEDEKNSNEDDVNNGNEKPLNDEPDTNSHIPQTQKTTPTTSTKPPTLNKKQEQKIQYEVGWMYNRAIYEMFTAYGIDRNSIDSVLLENLRSDIYGFIADMGKTERGQKNLALMFASASKRQEALLKFYPKFGNKNSAQLANFYQKTVNSEVWKSKTDLTKKQKQAFTTFHSNLISGQAVKILDPKNYLKNSLENVLNSDSFVISKNVQNTIDEMILQYGINQEFFIENESGQFSIAKNSQNEHDFVYIINNMSAGALALRFGIPSTIKINEQNIKKLRETLINYANNRAPELSQRIQATSLSKGMNPLNSKEVKKLKKDGIETEKHIIFASNTRLAIEKHGTETVAGGLEEKNKSKRKKLDKLVKQYKTFIPLWNNLSPKEQRIVYKKFNIAFDKNANKDTNLEFIPEFLFFDVSSLKTFKNLKKKKNTKKVKASNNKQTTNEELQALYQEFIEINQSLSSQEDYRRFLNDAYLYFAKAESFGGDDQVLLLADYINSGQALNTYPNQSFFDNVSPRELMFSHEQMQADNYQLSDANNHLTEWKGLSRRVKNSKAYKGLKKRFSKWRKKKTDPKKLMAKALASSAEASALKGLSAVSNLILPGSGVLLYALGSKIGYKNAMALIGTALAILIGKTLYALTTLGGLIGGIAGGVIGFFVGGPGGIIPGVIIGANVGQAVNSTSLLGSSAGGQTALNSVAPNTIATAQNTAAQNAAIAKATAAKSAGGIVAFTSSTALMATSLPIIMVFFTTLFIVFTIQSSFLVPLPNKRFDVSFIDETNINCNSTVTKLPFAKNTSNPIVARAYDIVDNLEQGFWCYWNKSPDYPNLFNQQEYNSYPYHCVYNDHYPTNCQGDWQKLQSGNSLFWCTWLINKAYQENFSLRSSTMANQFKDRSEYEYLDANTTAWNEIHPGDAIFSTTEGRNGNIGHVEIVFSVTQDNVRTINSNSSVKYHDYTVSQTTGKLQQIGSYISIVGFGRKL